MSEAEMKETENETEIELELEEESGTDQVEPSQTDEEQTEAETLSDDQSTESESAETSGTESDELSEYTQGVQKRIDSLTNKRREAERREQAALDYAESMKKQLEQLRSENKKNETSLVGEFGSRVESELEAAKVQYREAQDESDPDKLFEATQKISRLALEQSRYEEAKNKLERAEAEPEDQVASPPPPPNVPDPKAQAWAERNDWFGEDQSMTYAAMGIHQKLVQEGVDPTTDDYYERLDAQLKEDFPSKYPKDNNAKSSKPPVAAATNTASRAPSKRKRTIKLTESEKAIARKLNVPYEAYAKEVAKLNKDR